MRFDERGQGPQRGEAGTGLIGKRRETEIDAFAGMAVVLAVKWLLLAELIEQEQGEESRAEHTARRDMEGSPTAA